MTNTPKTAESSVAQASDNAAENTTEEATGRRVRILTGRSAGFSRSCSPPSCSLSTRAPNTWS